MHKTLIIAEAGINHNGDVEIAKKLIDVAAKAKANYVKFQTFKTEKLVSKDAEKAEYQIDNTSSEGSQYEMLKKLELDTETHHVLLDYCKQKNIKFLSTGFDLDSLELLNKLDINLFKIPSGEITNFPYLKRIASFKKPIILSTGMCSMQEINDAIIVLTQNGMSRDNLTILHCNTEYPTPIQDVNLNAMLSIQKELGIKVGYSDHTLGIEIPIAAVAMGAVCIEKHFTLDRNMKGPDHKASLEPSELKEMVRTIRNIEMAMGDGIKKPSQSEKKNIVIARKSIFINKSLEKGEEIKEENLIVKRPGYGISPMIWEEIIGKKVNKNLKTGEILNINDLM